VTQTLEESATSGGGGGPSLDPEDVPFEARLRLPGVGELFSASPSEVARLVLALIIGPVKVLVFGEDATGNVGLPSSVGDLDKDVPPLPLPRAAPFPFVIMLPLPSDVLMPSGRGGAAAFGAGGAPPVGGKGLKLGELVLATSGFNFESEAVGEAAAATFFNCSVKAELVKTAAGAFSIEERNRFGSVNFGARKLLPSGFAGGGRDGGPEIGAFGFCGELGGESDRRG